MSLIMFQAPAVTEAPTVLKKTKSGRVSKQKTTTGTTKAAPKKTASKKATPKKSGTPKKAEASAEA
jgi:histone H1/5